MTVKRLGGAYGSKLTRSAIVAAGCALTAHIMNKYVNIDKALSFVHIKWKKT